MPRIVELKDSTPLLIKPADTVNGVVAVCRCGLSANWPYCNGTHKATIGEDPKKLYHYDVELPQGTPRRHEIDLGALEEHSRAAGGTDSRSDRAEQGSGQATDAPHGPGATPVRPPRPPAQHANPTRTEGRPPVEPDTLADGNDKRS